MAPGVLDPAERLGALRLARRAIEEALGPAPVVGPAPTGLPDGRSGPFAEKRGVFVTLERYPSGALRGCIGYPLPVLPLGAALARAAVAAAIEDPRFPPVRPEEVARLLVEVSVLTVPTPIPPGRPETVAASVEVGRDGLILEGFGTSGLLLPQVATEQGWTAEEFLAGTCEKAGLPATAWRRPGVTIRRFQAEVFREASPGGPCVDVPTVRAVAERRAPKS